MLGSFMNRISRRKQRWALVASLGLAAAGAVSVSVWAEGPQAIDVKKNRAYPQWEIHDMKRPKPPVVTPGTFSTQDQPGQPPNDAVVLFDGKDPSKWNGVGGEGGWKVENGYMEIVPGAGAIQTRAYLGDCQLHLEWAAPVEVTGAGQERGNSGVLLMGLYELQILDGYANPTYADGAAAALYGQYPPLVNACRRPGEWQAFEILWTAPRFAGGQVARPAYVTVLHNGVVVHHHTALLGPTQHGRVATYRPHPPTGPLQLQDHGARVCYRNIWYRPLKGYDAS